MCIRDSCKPFRPKFARCLDRYGTRVFCGDLYQLLGIGRMKMCIRDRPVMVARWGIDPATKANQITREQKRELVQLCKHWRVSIDARGDLAHAVITCGGVSVREVDPKTMQSKKAQGLYFAGEVLDVDAYTGGYNLQIAFCTAQSFANNL